MSNRLDGRSGRKQPRSTCLGDGPSACFLSWLRVARTQRSQRREDVASLPCRPGRLTSYGELVTEILRVAEEIDQAEDELYGENGGDELPEQLRTPEGRPQALAEAKRRLAERKGRAIGDEEEVVDEPVVDPELVLGRGGRRGGRREWPRVARRELEEQRAREGRAIPRDREDRLFQALGRLEQNHRVDLAANEAYEHWRATARDTKGRVPKGNSKPFVAPALPEGVNNLSDPDSRVMRTQGTPPRQAYNTQTSVNENQIILAAEITVDAADFGHLEPMLDTTLRHLERHGVRETPNVLLGDAGYWHTRQIQSITARGIEVLIPPDGHDARGQTPGLGARLLREDAPQAQNQAGSQALRAARGHR
jgi:hypothetical protein